jgi:hypothetical protein
VSAPHHRLTRLSAVAFLAVVPVACALAPPPVGTSADRDGLVLKVSVQATGSSIVVETTVRNDRAEPVHLVPDQCGRVTEVLMARTTFEAEGEQWDGSLQAVKVMILRDQLSRQHPDKFHPRIPGNRTSETPPCQRPDRPVRLPPGNDISERWELPFGDMFGAQVLSAVGSAGSLVRVELVEAKAPDELEYLDIIQAGSPEADEARRGRALRAEVAASTVIDRAPTASPAGPSLGQLFDQLVHQNAQLRGWIEAQPADSWRHVALAPAYPQFSDDPESEKLHLSMVTTGYERAATVSAGPTGDGAVLDLPGERDRTRDFPRRAATMPPGVQLIHEREAPEPTDDVILGEVILPSGRIAVGGYLFEEEVLEITVPPGAYPAHATLVRYEDLTGAIGESVALASLVLSDAPTVRWEEANVIPVDGGTATITSAEVLERLASLITEDEDRWWSLEDEIFDSMMAHDYIGTEWPVTEDLNLVRVSSGYGDGGYPVFVGFDAGGSPTRVVVDFVLLHLDWPAGGQR